MDHLIHEIARTAEHAAIYRMVGALMRGHDLAATLAIGAIIVAVSLIVRRRRSR